MARVFPKRDRPRGRFLWEHTRATSAEGFRNLWSGVFVCFETVAFHRLYEFLHSLSSIRSFHLKPYSTIQLNSIIRV